MAKTVITTDDLDGSSGAESVSFSYGGKSYEIDLAKKNRVNLDKLLKPYIDVARVSSTGGRRATGAGRGRRSSTVDLTAVRAWAAENGIEVSSRGRIAAAVMDEYNAAH